MIVIEPDTFGQLLTALQNAGYTTIGPRLRDGAIVLDEVRSLDDIPKGVHDDHDRGTYRVSETSSPAFFEYVVGPQSWKKFLHPPLLRLFSAKRNGKGFSVEREGEAGSRRYAFIGVRPCDLHAIQVLDKVLLEGPYVDCAYRARRLEAFILAVNCTVPGRNCFCASMNTGPRAGNGYDLALIEIVRNGTHHFLVEIGSEKGREIITGLPQREATEAEVAEGDALLHQAATSMTKSVDTIDLVRMLNNRFEDARWDEVAQRCLACANCTMVCPTCFCTTVEDTTDLAGMTAERRRVWDSCFTADFTHIAGGTIRKSTRSRYRQWLMHKFAHWQGQFNTFGCIGCGRCITWCPVRIDVTEEIQYIRQSHVSSQTV